MKQKIVFCSRLCTSYQSQRSSVLSDVMFAVVYGKLTAWHCVRDKHTAIQDSAYIRSYPHRGYDRNKDEICLRQCRRTS